MVTLTIQKVIELYSVNFGVRCVDLLRFIIGLKVKTNENKSLKRDKGRNVLCC